MWITIYAFIWFLDIFLPLFALSVASIILVEVSCLIASFTFGSIVVAWDASKNCFITLFNRGIPAYNNFILYYCIIYYEVSLLRLCALLVFTASTMDSSKFYARPTFIDSKILCLNLVTLPWTFSFWAFIYTDLFRWMKILWRCGTLMALRIPGICVIHKLKRFNKISIL